MTDFTALQQSYFHRVSVAPSEAPTFTLVGSDIVSHLPVLEYYASLCSHVTEFGTREGESTVALLSGCKGVVHSYDIERTPIVGVLEKIALPCKWEFHRADTSDASLDVPETEMLFIDTLHTYVHVKKELNLWGRKATRFLAFHDTFTCGETDRSGPDPRAKGILPAIQEFIAQYPGEYRTVYETKRNNGLLVLERLATA